MQTTTKSGFSLERIFFRHTQWPMKEENPKWTDARSGSAFFVYWWDTARTSRFIGRVWHNTQGTRTPGCWTWTLQDPLASGAPGPIVDQGFADSRQKALQALHQADVGRRAA